MARRATVRARAPLLLTDSPRVGALGCGTGLHGRRECTRPGPRTHPPPNTGPRFERKAIRRALVPWRRELALGAALERRACGPRAAAHTQRSRSGTRMTYPVRMRGRREQGRRFARGAGLSLIVCAFTGFVACGPPGVGRCGVTLLIRGRAAVRVFGRLVVVRRVVGRRARGLVGRRGGSRFCGLWRRRLGAGGNGRESENKSQNE